MPGRHEAQGRHRAGEPTAAQEAEARRLGSRAAAAVAGNRVGNAIHNAKTSVGETPPSKTN